MTSNQVAARPSVIREAPIEKLTLGQTIPPSGLKQFLEVVRFISGIRKIFRRFKERYFWTTVGPLLHGVLNELCKKPGGVVLHNTGIVSKPGSQIDVEARTYLRSTQTEHPDFARSDR